MHDWLVYPAEGLTVAALAVLGTRWLLALQRKIAALTERVARLEGRRDDG